MQARFDRFKETLSAACKKLYAEHLLTLAFYGSWARQAATPASDIDLLVICAELPGSRGKRMRQFLSVDAETLEARKSIWDPEIPAPEIAPLIKTPPEVEAGSPLFLDMTDWCDILFDRDGYFQNYLKGLRGRMLANGSERRFAKGGYYWVYKPDRKPGEVVTL